MSDHTTCTLSILACRADVPYLEHIVRHLVRACNFPFAERLLTVDVGRGAAARASNPGTTASLEELRACGERLRQSGTIDRIVEFDDTFGTDPVLSYKHFGRRLPQTRDCRGVPLWGWIRALEACRTDHLLHFDCDLLLHQRRHHSWVAAGIELLQRRPDVMFVLPLPGPPAPNGQLYQKKDDNYEHDGDGFYRFHSFTSRKFLVQRSRFEQLLPLRPAYLSRKRRLLQMITGRNAIRNWEAMVTRRLRDSRFVRADLDSPQAWTLHSHEHGPRFVRALPSIIERVEQGWFPPQQAGRYDLQLDWWV